MTEDLIGDEAFEFDEPANEEREEYFNRERTLKLIELFKIYRPSNEANDVRTMKEMWEIMSREMSALYQIHFTPAKCENRYKVLERNYKKIVKTLDKGEQPKKMFPFFAEFQAISRHKKYTIIPELTSKDYEKYTRIDFNNKEPPEEIPTTCPITYLQLQNVKQEIINSAENYEEPTTEYQQPELIPSEQLQDYDSKIEIKHEKKLNYYQAVEPTVFFNKERLTTLFQLYKKYNQKYLERTIKTKHRMWYIIAREMANIFKMRITPAKCENKLRVLERNYKRAVTLKRRCEYQNELKEIFGNKIDKQAEETPAVPTASSLPSTSIGSPETRPVTQPVTFRLLDVKSNVENQLETTLTAIRDDFRLYYTERLNIEREKLALKRQKLLLLQERALCEGTRTQV
ncbi:unnamed protein product [Phyllotreta striolata]|uniref:Myb/SANT-like DNA-binding domain-containing protein n=1 Tax=Phyllotreta striolata TaxID=444603 RepID=A0A9N9TD61_PHYSR|nr:unnamed protein product [Phyllotreta striolata]